MIADHGSGFKATFTTGNIDNPLEGYAMRIDNPTFDHAISGASTAVSGDVYRNPLHNPFSDESKRLARIDAALDELNRLADPQDANRWINRIIGGWPGYGYDSVRSLETVVKAFAAFDSEIRAYNRELAGAGRRERSL